MLSMFCKCDKETEFQSIIHRLESLRSSNLALQENVDRLIREIGQLKLYVISDNQPQPQKPKGKK